MSYNFTPQKLKSLKSLQSIPIKMPKKEKNLDKREDVEKIFRMSEASLL